MNDQPNDTQVIDEIRALREDVRRHVRNGLWVFSGAVVLVCLVFGSRDMRGILVLSALLIGFLFLIGQCFQALFNARLRKRHERERFAILSGRAAVSRRTD